MRLEICVPAYNEARIIKETVRTVRRHLTEANIEHTITVVDNGSTDTTVNEARSAGTRIISLHERGKGAAVIAGARESHAETFGFIDADLSADPTDIATLLIPIEAHECDIAIGSRLINSDIVDRAFLRTLSSKVFNLIRISLLGIHAQDTQCGLKLMNAKGKAILAECKETGWFFDLEFLARSESAGLRIREIPVHWNEHRFPGRASKLRMVRDGFGAVRAMLRIRKRLRT